MSAAPGTTFGAGPRDEALVRSAVAEGDTTDAATENPAFAAAEGTRVRLGYGGASPFLRVNDHDVGVLPITGMDLGAHVGRKLTSNVWGGLALALHRPDLQIARISFRPATEPAFVLYEAAQQRLSLDTVAALRYGRFAVGGGASVALGVAGPGVDVAVTQNANGPKAEGGFDIELGYRFAPLAGVMVDLGRLSLGASFRGELAVDLSLDTFVKVDLEGNPLNGTTTVLIRGPSGYEPPRIDVGARFLALSGLRAFAGLEYAVYSAAPAPIADVTIDVDLATKPALRQGSFPQPGYYDTLSVMIGAEWRYPSPELPSSFLGAGGPPGGAAPASGARASKKGEITADSWKIALRGGYSFSPSPVPPQTGFTSYADGSRHAIGLGAAYHAGDVLGIDFTLSFAAQFHKIESRRERKASPALPFADYEVGGEIVRGSFAIEGFVR